MKLTLDPWQKEFLVAKGDKLLCTGRQVGKSILCAMDAGNWAINNKKKVVLMIAPTERQAYALFNKTLDYIYRNANELIMRGRHRPTKSKISLSNGTIIWCLPTGLSGLGIRFLTIDRLYEEEASRIPEAVQDAVTPMLLTTGGDTIFLSTPSGTKGLFYDTLINKNNAFSDTTIFRTDSEKVMRERKICATWTEIQRDKALLRISKAKARMTTLAFAQEYMGQPLNDLLQVFPDELLEEVMVLERLPSNMLLPPRRDFFLGQDIAGMGKDTSTWEILDGTNKKAVRQMENITKKKLRLPGRIKTTLDLERQYHFKKIGIDNGGLGSEDFGEMLELPETRRKVISLNNASKDLNRDGTKSTRLLKEDMYNNLLGMMEKKEIKLLKDDSIFESLRSIQFETTGGKTKYHSDDSHIAEGLIRSAWLVKSKSLNIYIY